MESGNCDKKSPPLELPADVRREEMDLIFQECRADDWERVLHAVTANPLVGLGQMVMDNHISTTIIHQAITSKGDTNHRARVILKILEVTPAAASIRNGYGSLPLHVIAQRNTKMKAETKEKLITALVHANVEALATEGGTGKRTPLHIIFTDYISPSLTKMMINNGARACFMRDKKGWLPAHVACSRHCSPEKLRMLLAVNPSALFELTQDDQSLLDLAKSTATKSHPNFALIDELTQQLNRRQQAGSRIPPFIPPPYIPHTPVSSEDSGSAATRNRVGSSDSANSSHPSVAEVAENMGNVAVSLPGHHHDHHMEPWEQQPPHQQFHPHELQPQQRPMPPLQQYQHQHHQHQHQNQQYTHHHQQQSSRKQPPQQHCQTQDQHSRKRKVTDANAASEALLLLSRDQRDHPPASQGTQGTWASHDMYDHDHPTQFAKV